MLNKSVSNHVLRRYVVLMSIVFSALMISATCFAVEMITEDFDEGLANWEPSTIWNNTEYYELINEDGNNILTYQHDSAAWIKWLLIDPTVANYAIEARVRFDYITPYTYVGLVFRATGTEEWINGSWNLNHYQIQLNANGYVQVLRRINWDVDRTELAADVPFQMKPRQWYDMRAEVVDGTITVYVDGERTFFWEDPNPLPPGDFWLSFGQGKILVDKITWIPLE